MVLRAPAGVPPLESGDVMTRAEFHALYSLHDEIKKAELIQGVVYVASPQRAEDHGDHEGDISFWLGVYRWQHPEMGLHVAHNSTVLLDDLNEPQPDLSLRLAGGTSTLEDGYISGPPELIVEVAYSSVSRDLHSKKKKPTGRTVCPNTSCGACATRRLIGSASKERTTSRSNPMPKASSRAWSSRVSD